MNEKTNSKLLARLRQLVTTDPEIMRGTPVFKRTRIPVDLVAVMLAQGATAEEILAGYPTLNEEMISLALPYPRNHATQRPSNRRRKFSKKVGSKSFSLDALLKRSPKGLVTSITLQAALRLSRTGRK